MTVPVLRHVVDEPMGFLLYSLTQFGLRHRFYDLYREPDRFVGSDEIGLDEAPALIILGGPQSVNDPLPWLEREARIVEKALCRNIPVLGLCLGAQILAKATGARVSKLDGPEIGWYPVRAKEGAAIDPLFHDWGEQTVFHWHDESFELPQGATSLAASAACDEQAFRYGDRHWGLQFHLEVTSDMIRGWRKEDDACGDALCRDDIDPEEHAAENRLLAARVFDRWARMVAGGFP